MKLKDFHSVFIGRMGPSGNEKEVREVVRSMALALHSKFPTLIRSPEEYLAMKNADKYASAPSVSLAATREGLVGCTVATPEAKILFKALNLPEAADYLVVAEFAARVTYLAFPKSPETLADCIAYLRKMAYEFQHLSVFASTQLALSPAASQPASLHTLKELLQAALVNSPSPLQESLRSRLSLFPEMAPK